MSGIGHGTGAVLMPKGHSFHENAPALPSLRDGSWGDRKLSHKMIETNSTYGKKKNLTLEGEN